MLSIYYFRSSYLKFCNNYYIHEKYIIIIGANEQRDESECSLVTRKLPIHSTSSPKFQKNISFSQQARQTFAKLVRHITPSPAVLVTDIKKQDLRASPDAITNCMLAGANIKVKN
jgi:hypothetical protein